MIEKSAASVQKGLGGGPPVRSRDRKKGKRNEWLPDFLAKNTKGGRIKSHQSGGKTEEGGTKKKSDEFCRPLSTVKR